MAQTDTKTIIGVFDDYNTAEKAARELEQSGVPRSSIEVASHLKTGAAGSSGRTSEHEGGVKGFFPRMFGGGAEEDAGHFAEVVRRGAAAVCVTAPSGDIDRIANALNNSGAIDVDRRVSEYRQAGYTGYDPSAPPYSSEEAARERERLRGGSSTQSIPVIEEDLRVGKRAVQRGGVRIYSRMVEQPVEEEVRLREERVYVERRPVNRPVEPGDVARSKDQTIEVREMGEEPVVEKRSRVTEEVRVSKEEKERQEKVRDTVRHTEVKVDRLGAEAWEEYSKEFRSDYDKNYAGSGMRYEDVEPAYRYGYTMARDPKYQGKSWTDVESRLKTDYATRYPGSSWDRTKNAVRYGWDRVTSDRS
jgi:uncharacterized protein (TIGR02271 family)